MINKHLFGKIPPEELCRARLKLDEATGILEPHFAVITPSERLSFKKTGPALMRFLELSHGLAVESPELFPAFIKAEVFREEYFTTRELRIIVNKIDQLRDNVCDTEILSGNRALEIAIAFYKTVKMAAMRDIPGARVIFEELKLAYPSSSRGRRKVLQAENTDRQLELFEDP